MIAGILNWNRQSESIVDLLRMQKEVGPFPLGAWDSCLKPGFTLTASEQEGISALAQDESLTAVLDGVIYNQDEIVPSLEGQVDCSSRDVNLVLAGYRRWGQNVLDHLIGDFAFAVWDSSAGTLFAAVDPFGLRPFYFASGPGRFAFGSRMSQLRFLPWVGKELDERMIVSFLLDKFKDPQATFYTKIKQIPGGHYLWTDGRRVTVKRYWRPGAQNVCQATRPGEVLDEFRDRFRRAVIQRLDRKQSTGILMSGGLDSTAMAGMTADICRREPGSGPQISVISALFGDFPCDESGYIDAALSRLPFPSQKIDGRNGAYGMQDLRVDMRRHEWPVLHRQGPLFNGFRGAAQSCGARILLNGLGGDELTTDYRYYTTFMNGAHPLGILRAAHWVRQVEKMSLGNALYLLAREGCPEEIKIPYRWLRRRIRPDPEPMWSSWLGTAYQQTARQLERANEACPEDFGSDTLNLAWRILTNPGASWANRFLVDEFSTAAIQCRFPFLDRRLFDLVFSVRPHLRPRCRGRPWFKPYIAQALGAYLPPEIRLRDAKVDFESYNCYVFGRCLEFLRPYLFDDGLWESAAFVPRNQAWALFQEVRQSQASSSIPGFIMRRRMEALRNIAGLELWLRDWRR